MSRGMYLRTADMLRASHEPVTPRHRHSDVSAMLRTGVIESETLLTIKLAGLQSWSALSSHPNVDPKKASESMKTKFFDVVGTIPYLTSGTDGSQVETDSRMALANRYRELKRNLLKGRGDDTI